MTRVMKNLGFGIIILIGLGILFFVSSAVYAAEVKIAVIDSGTTGPVDFKKSFTSLRADEDPLNHGTQVAHLIRQNNPSAKIHMLQVCEISDGKAKPSRDAILKAIAWAVENHMDIVNLSLVLKYDERIEKAITDAATSHGILFVAAAGNRTIASRFAADEKGYVHKVQRTVKPAFPASDPHVIAVGGLDESGNIAKYSDKTCDIYEKGSILGQEGSSFACARVTGRIAQALSAGQIPASTKQAVLAFLK